MDDDGDNSLPHYKAPGYTADQLAMLELLGNPPVLRDSSIVLYHEERSGTEDVPSIAPAHTMEHPCPVVEVLGRQRSILPNGDLHSQNEKVSLALV